MDLPVSVWSQHRPICVMPRVWIGCLACYNEGNLVGDWFDADVADDRAAA